ncbi:unnamed protein product, partial [Amoebophrya sp. A120]
VACNTQHCPIDCKLSAWDSGTECTKTCGTGTKTFTRTIEVHPEHNGKKCDEALTRNEACNTDPCPIDCVLSEWTNDSNPCSETCGPTGKQGQIRSVETAPQHGGAECEGADQANGIVASLSREVSCNTGTNCPIDCVVTDWYLAIKCPVTCGGAEKHFKRNITIAPDFG